MKKSVVFSVVFYLVAVFGGMAWAGDQPIIRPFVARTFAVMPEVANFPEGITANPYNGDIFVSTFEFNQSGTETNGIVRFNRRGRVEAKSDFFGNNVPLLGLAFNTEDYKVYVASVGNFQGVASTIQRIAANFTDGTVLEHVANIPNIGPPPDRIVPNPDTSMDTIMFGNFAAVPNGLALRDGALYVSDSFQGIVFRIEDVANCPPSCAVVPIVQHPLLATAGFPPFGANGLAIRGDTLFVANTGDDNILQIPLNEDGLPATDPPTVTEFARSINGADGLALDYHGNLWVAANQADQVVKVNGDGRVDGEFGEFFGINKKDAPIGFLFPASIAIFGHNMFVTNLALPLTTAVGDEWEEEVTTYTVSRIRIVRDERDHHDEDDDDNDKGKHDDDDDDDDDHHRRHH